MPKLDARTDTFGLVVALPAEAHSIGVHGLQRGDCVRWQHGWIALSGVGPDNARRATRRLLTCGVRSIANWGVAGALDTRLAPGDVLVPDEIGTVAGEPGFRTDPDSSEGLRTVLARSRLRLHRGVLWSSPRPVATRADKQALYARSGAAAVDMEAASIAALAARARVPFVAIKTICDPASRELPTRMLAALNDSDGTPTLRMLSAIALGGPASWRAAGSLARDFARARRALTTAAALAT